MPRGYRYLIFASFGWLALSAASPSNQQSPAANKGYSSTQVREAGQAIVAAIRDTNKPAEHDGGCAKSSEKRESDLCAQWKAADAAADAATYAFWSLIGTAVGTGLLVWTLAETRANSRRELRAYLSVKVMGMEITAYESGHYQFNFLTITHNGGSTPAYNCNHYGFIRAMPPEFAAVELQNVKPISPGDVSGSVIHSGEDFTAKMTRNPPIDPAGIQALKDGKLVLYAFGVTSYHDTFGRPRRTDFCYLIETEAFSDGLKASVAAPGDQVPIEWIIAPFHNSAT